MKIKIQCPHCAQRISATDDVIGKTVECPTCQRTFKAAAPEEPKPPKTNAPDTAPDTAPTTDAPDTAPTTDAPTIDAPPTDATPPSTSSADSTPAQAPRNPARSARLVPAVPPTPRGKGSTVIVAGSALVVLAAGLYCWQTFGPGFHAKPPAPAGSTKTGAKPGDSTQPPSPASANVPPVGAAPDALNIDPKDLQGIWRGTIPRTVIAKPYDLTVTITYNDRGEGFPKFEAPEANAAAEFSGLATIFHGADGKDKVVLLRDWVVTLGPEKKTMLWTEVNGPAQVKFTKQE